MREDSNRKNSPHRRTDRIGRRTRADVPSSGSDRPMSSSSSESGGTSSTPVIQFDHVTKTYPSEPAPALSDISLTIDQGEFVFLIGKSGSGKSTFIHSLIRDVVPDSGTLLVGGYDLVSMRKSRVPYLRRKIGCVFQDFKLLPNKTAYENVAFAMECVGAPKAKIRRQVQEVLSFVELRDKMDKLPDELSGGEQQRVSIARALVNQPPLLICDEPTGNLDPETSASILNLLHTINATTGTTVLIATHDKEAVNRMQARVIKLEHGHLVSDCMNGGYTDE